MPKTIISDIKDLLERSRKNRERFIQDENTQGMPYFRIFFKKIQEIKIHEDIPNIIKFIEETKETCRKSSKYKTSIMSILSFCDNVINFLENQKDIEKFTDYKETIDNFLEEVKLTNEDDSSLSGSKSSLKNSCSNLINNNENITSLETKLEIANEENEKLKTKLETANQENEKLKTKLETANQENEKLKTEFQTTLNTIKDKINSLFNNNIVSDFIGYKTKLIQKARKWWHIPLKILSCGLWESKEIRKINEKFSFENFQEKLITELKKDINEISFYIRESSNKLDSEDIELKNRTNNELLVSSTNNFDNDNLHKTVSMPNIALI